MASESEYYIVNMDTDRERASRLRRRLYGVHRQFEKQLRVIMRREPVIKGIVYILRRRCGKAGCRCVEGHLHETWALTVPEKGHKRMRSVPKGQRVRWSELAGRYRRFRRARAMLVKLFREILKEVDALERQRTIPPPEP